MRLTFKERFFDIKFDVYYNFNCKQMRRVEGNESRMEAVYGEYCKRHEAAVQKLQEFDKDENVQGWLQVIILYIEF